MSFKIEAERLEEEFKAAINAAIDAFNAKNKELHSEHGEAVPIPVAVQVIPAPVENPPVQS